MPPPRFFILAAIVLCSNAVEAVTGFGSTIIAVTLGAHFYPIDRLVVILVPVNIVLSSYIVIRHREAVNARELFRGILPASGAGLAVGIAVFHLAEVDTLRIAYGTFVLCLSVREVHIALRTAGDFSPKPLPGLQSFFWLLSGGIMQGIYASGGPMVVYYAGRKLTDKRSFRSTLSGLWLILSTALFASHVVSGKATIGTLRESAGLLASLALGIVIGETIHERIPEKTFRVFVFAILIFAGAALILRAR
ncbi:MAG: sulfite exporter TauE/SafE family protein [bacterium]